MLLGVNAAFKRNMEPLGDASLCGLPRRHCLSVPDPDATTTSGVDTLPQPRPAPESCGLPRGLLACMSSVMALPEDGDVVSSALLLSGETRSHLVDEL